MHARLVGSLLIVLTILGLVAPRFSAAFASAGSGVRTVFICTGAGLQSIRIEESGDPVSVSQHDDHCLFAHASDTTVRIDPLPTLVVPVARIVPRPGDLLRLSHYGAPRSPPRALPGI